VSQLHEELRYAMQVLRRHPDQQHEISVITDAVGWLLRGRVRDAIEGARAKGATAELTEERRLISSTFQIELRGTGRQLTDTVSWLLNTLAPEEEW
jgi:hypothetical protein